MNKQNIKNQFSSYAFLFPAIIIVGLFTVFPIIYTGYLSLTNQSLYKYSDYSLIGLKNFFQILSGTNLAEVSRVFSWTLIWAISSTVLSGIVGFIYAFILNNPDLKGRYLYRTLLIIPWAVPSFISIMMWQGLLNDNFGIVNQLLASLGLGSIPWLTNPFWAKIAVLGVNLWVSFPFMMVVTLGALQNIPPELYEAAEVDGARWWKKTAKITLPLLRTTMVPVYIMSFANQFNQFGGIYLLTMGGPPVPGGNVAGSTDILLSYTYKLAFQKNLYGMGSAFCILLFLLIVGISIINMRMTGALKEVE